MVYLRKKINPFAETFSNTIPYTDKYNSFRLVTYTPLTLSQKVSVAAFSEPSRMVGGDF